jgi:hypothetical protein
MATSTAPATGEAQQPRTAARRALPAAGSRWWLVAVAAAFTLAQLVVVAPRLGLSWDEIVSVSQVSMHAPASAFGPPRARGVSLLVAPVALVTASVHALRVYLAILSGLGLFLVMLVWARLRPAWTIALGGLFFASLWVSEYYGPQAMPDFWVALSVLGAVGFFLLAAESAGPESAGLRAGPRVAGLRAGPGVAGPAAVPQREAAVPQREAAVPQREAAVPQREAAVPERRRGALAGLAVCLALAALIRPGDAVFLTAGLVLAIAAVRGWRRWSLLAATVLGLLAGSAEWVIEAFIRFGGPLERLKGAGHEQGGFGLHAGIWDQLRAVNGPTLCRPCLGPVKSPGLSLWWLVLPAVVVLGVLAARQAGRMRSALLPAACAGFVGFQYLFLISYAAPRFLLPMYALLAIPVADALAWLITGVRADLRPLTMALVAVVLAVQVLTQQVVLNRQVAAKVSFFGDYRRIAADLNRMGVRAPCLVNGVQEIPIAFYAGCGSAAAIPVALRAGHVAAGRVAVLVPPRARPPAYAAGWRRVTLPGLRNRALILVAYLPLG